MFRFKMMSLLLEGHSPSLFPFPTLVEVAEIAVKTQFTTGEEEECRWWKRLGELDPLDST